MKKVVAHVVLFLVVEIFLLQGIFGTWPSIELVSLTGIGHLVYYGSIPFAMMMTMRYHRAKYVWYVVPIIIHLLVHIMPTWAHCHHDGCAHMFFRIHSYPLVGMGVVILCGGEYFLHQKRPIV